MNPEMIKPNAGGQPHDNMPPYLVINYCIAAEGIFPSRATDRRTAAAGQRRWRRTRVIRSANTWLKISWCSMIPM